MHAGHIISGAAHAGLIGWMLFGSIAVPPEPAVEVTEVALVSDEEYAAMIAAQEPPGATTEVAEPAQPEPEAPETPEVSAAQDTAPEQAEPEAAEATEPDPVPDQPDPIPQPSTDVADDAPAMAQPEEDVAALPDQPPTPDAAPRDVPRVAPRPVERPEPDVKVDEEVRQPAEPSETAEIEQEEQEATAPEEATTEIVTEAEEEGTRAPTSSPRPRLRPERRTAAAEPPEEPTPPAESEPDPAPDNEDAISAALEKAMGGGQESETEAPVPSGPPLSAGEKDALRVAVSNCWNVGSLSTAAMRVTVVVAVSMAEDGTPITGSIEMLSASGGSDAAARQAFEAARRAIIRCGTGGYDLPREKYGQWRDIEMTFNPEKMRIK